MGFGQQTKEAGETYTWDDPEASEQDTIFGEDYIGDYTDDPDDEGTGGYEGGHLNNPNDPRSWTDDYREYMEGHATGTGIGGSYGTLDEQFRGREHSQEMARRRAYGLENEEMYEYANKLAEIAEGKRKTAGQIEAEKNLAVMASGQRGAGRSRGRGSFDVAEALRLGGMSAQGVESEGGAMIGAAARDAQMGAAANLEQLLISGQERAKDKQLQMERLRYQQEQASGTVWSNILSGVLGAIGAVGGSFIGQPVAGGMLGAGAGKGFGKFIG